MSVIAWDGKTLAADRMQTDGTIRSTCTKVQRFGLFVLATCGTGAHGTMLKDWFRSGAHFDEFPKPDDNVGKAILIVMNDDGFVSEYRGCPIHDVIEDKFYAWGEGSDFAMGAMAMGADARKAVEVANQLCVSCGFGVDAFDAVGHS